MTAFLLRVRGQVTGRVGRTLSKRARFSFCWQVQRFFRHMPRI